MKRFLAILILLAGSVTLYSQQINKELVVVEITTGTWCQYCPGAAMGADELIENFGDAVAIIKNHGGDLYENDGSRSRIDLYQTSGYPTAYFNGTDEVGGGSNTETMYPYYLPVYNSTISEMTSFDATLELTPVSDYIYDATLTIDRVDDYSGTALIAHLVLTESDIEESWQGMDELNFVNRSMFPNEFGTQVDFGSGDQQVINYTVTIDEDWVIENCELVAFIQDYDTKEILQGTKYSMNFPIGVNNAMLKGINHPTGDISICEDAIEPVITIKNRGSENLSSLVVEYEINGEGIQSYNWSGDLAFGETEEVILDEISFTPSENNLLEVMLTLPNNETDDDLANNTKEAGFDKSIETTSRIYLEINPSGSFGLPWEVTESDGTVVYSGTASGSDIITETLLLDLDKCYAFTITSPYGNGIPGDGYFQLTDSENELIYYGEGDSFTESYVLPFKVTILSSVNELSELGISLYPNPVNDRLFISNAKNIEGIQITDISGRNMNILSTEQNSGEYTILTDQLRSGIYFVNIITKANIFSQKIIVIH